jgi:hypothetical protein
MSTSSRVLRADRLQTALGALALAASFAWLAAPVAADDLSDFEHARRTYEGQNYARAVKEFHALVGTTPPRLADRLLVLESRKYLAASLLFVSDAEGAREQFRLLLSAEPDYVVDPLGFPTEVVELFDRTKAELIRAGRAQLEFEKRRAEEALRARQAVERRERLNLARLIALASHVEIREANSRWIASMPFGVGQFQNGHNALGVLLAMAEGLAAGASAVTFLGHERLREERPSPDEIGNTRERERVWRKTNVISFAVFVGLGVLGIVDAHLRFVPDRVTATPRPLPPDLERWAREQRH